MSPENTAEDVPEDDIIESLSDLFPRSDESPTDNQAEALEGDQENNQDNDDDDKSKDND